MDYLAWGEWVALEQHFMYGIHEFRRAKGVSRVNTWQSEGQLNTAFWGCRQPPRCDDREIWACQESGMPRHRFNYNQNRYLGENLHYGETTRIKVNPDGVSKEMMGDEIVAIDSCFALGSSVWRNNQKALVKNIRALWFKLWPRTLNTHRITLYHVSSRGQESKCQVDVSQRKQIVGQNQP